MPWRPLLIGLLFLSYLPLSAQSPAAEQEAWDSSDLIDTHLEILNKQGQFSGTALIAIDQKIFYLRGVGLADRAKEVHCEPETRYLIGSVTKPFIASAILLLVQEGKLGLDDPIVNWFPDWPRAAEVSVRMLLNHRSGIRDYHEFPEWEQMAIEENDPISTLALVETDPYKNEPNELFGYSNTGYIMLGIIIEQLSGELLRDFMSENLFKPLGLKYSGIPFVFRDGPPGSTAYETTPHGFKDAPRIKLRQPFSSGNMYSSSVDLYRFHLAFRQCLLWDKDLVREALSIPKGEYGLGWAYRQYHGVEGYGHTGRMNGFVSSMAYLPMEGVFVSVLSNEANCPINGLMEDLIGFALGMDVPEPPKHDAYVLRDHEKANWVGTYEVKPGHEMRVFEDSGNMYLQEGDQPKHEIFPTKADKGYTNVIEFELEFVGARLGRATELRLIGRHGTISAVRKP